MEQIPRQEDHVDILFFGQTHDFVEAVCTVVAADSIAFVVAYVAVCGYEDTDCIGGCDSMLVHLSNNLRSLN